MKQNLKLMMNIVWYHDIGKVYYLEKKKIIILCIRKKRPEYQSRELGSNVAILLQHFVTIF